jgi:hypothetical protein
VITVITLITRDYIFLAAVARNSLPDLLSTRIGIA